MCRNSIPQKEGGTVTIQMYEMQKKKKKMLFFEELFRCKNLQ